MRLFFKVLREKTRKSVLQEKIIDLLSHFMELIKFSPKFASSQVVS